MLRWILHTGNYKTGSTSLQNHMAKNRELLREQGVYYGDLCEEIHAHANLSYGVLREALKEFGLWEQYQNHTVFDLVAEEPEILVEQMVKHAKDGKCQTIVISHESIFSEMYRTMTGIEQDITVEENDRINQWMRHRYLQLLSSYSENIMTVHYIRRQDLYAESQYNQYCKSPWYGATKIPDFAEFLASNPVSFDYKKQLDGWRDVFGRDRMLVKAYEKEQLPGGILEDFYETVLDLPRDAWSSFAEVVDNQSNLRLGRNVLEFKKRTNGFLPVLGELLCEYAIETGDTKEYAYFTEEERRVFLRQYQEGNRLVAVDYLDRSAGNLFYNDNMDFSEYPGLSVEKIQEIMGWLSGKLGK